MNYEDLAYLAGIIDGEGTVTLGGFKNLSYSLTPFLEITFLNINKRRKHNKYGFN